MTVRRKAHEATGRSGYFEHTRLKCGWKGGSAVIRGYMVHRVCPRGRHMKTASACLLGIVSLAIGWVWLPDGVDAQYHDVTAPVESPLWWTISREITPRELKYLHSDPATSLDRYDEAVASHLAEPLSAQDRRRLQFYYHPQMTPELAPMWVAFSVFCQIHIRGPWTGHEGVIDPDDNTANALRAFGISAPGVNAVMNAASTCAFETKKLADDLGPKQVEMQRLLADLQETGPNGARPPANEVGKAIREHDYSQVAAMTGRPTSEIRDLVDALGDWDAEGRLVAAILPSLRDNLTDSDWQLLRQYLLEKIVAGMGQLRVLVDPNAYGSENEPVLERYLETGEVQ